MFEKLPQILGLCPKIGHPKHFADPLNRKILLVLSLFEIRFIIIVLLNTSFLDSSVSIATIIV